MLVKKVITVLVCVFVASGYCEHKKGLNIVMRAIDECFKANERYSCVSEKMARAVERYMEWDLSIMDGMTLVRNDKKVNKRQAKLLGFDRLNQAIKNFFQTHVLALQLGGARKLGREGNEGGIGSFGGGGHRKKGMEKEKKYMQYALMVLLGIFGLTGPLIMKVLALIGAKALVASKAALIIVGSVAIKKLFEKDHRLPSVKVHTISHDDDYDRVSRYGYGYEIDQNNGPFYNSPYSSYYDAYYASGALKDNKV